MNEVRSGCAVRAAIQDERESFNETITWIPVAQRLPHPHERVLATIVFGDLTHWPFYSWPMMRTPEGAWLDLESKEQRRTPTHWAELPKGPRQR